MLILIRSINETFSFFSPLVRVFCFVIVAIFCASNITLFGTEHKTCNANSKPSNNFLFSFFCVCKQTTHLASRNEPSSPPYHHERAQIKETHPHSPLCTTLPDIDYAIATQQKLVRFKCFSAESGESERKAHTHTHTYRQQHNKMKAK